MKNVPIPVKFVNCISSQVLITMLSDGSTQEIPANDFVRKVEEGKFQLVNWPSETPSASMVEMSAPELELA
ncbi:MAG: hypothetical protein GC192_07310 [Bacteroidetes bacterium]|nr:hypothetical protein [Bacteroidota bacterium]